MMIIQATYKKFKRYTWEPIVNQIAPVFYAKCKTGNLNDTHKQSEKAFRECEERYRILFEESRDGMNLFDEHRDFIDVNHEFMVLSGYSWEELSTMKVNDLYSSPLEETEERIMALLKGKRIAPFETTMMKKSGEMLDVEISVSPFVRDGKQVFHSVLRDITERKRTERALRHSEEKYRLFLENFQGIAYQADYSNFRPFFFHGTVEKICGYSKEDLLSGPITWDKLIHPDDLPGIIKEGKKLASTPGYVVEKEYRIYHKNGEIRWVNDIARCIHDESGKMLFLQGTIYDINERVRAEKERMELESKLQQAYKMESIGTLAGGIAHDFNNILSPIMIHSEMAMMDLPPDSPLQHNLKQIYVAGERARGMVKQILAFSRQKDQIKTNIKMESILKEAVKLLRSSIPTTIDIRYEIEAETDTVFADPTQLHQIIINLCTNASHAMREKGGRLVITLDDFFIDSKAANQFSGLNPGSYLRLTIKDTGHGIEPDILDRIFEPYFTTKGSGEGSGMGLAVVHGIVTAHRGDITVESEPGKGSTFRILFPKIDGKNLEAPEREMKIPRGSERILFVDDEKVAVDAAQPMLEKLGYRVTARTSSVEALEAFRNDPGSFDLIITDQTMPNMTGKDLAKELISLRPDIPIILCTGYSEMIDRENVKDMGIDAFVMKPIIMHEIAHTMRKILDERQSFK